MKNDLCIYLLPEPGRLDEIQRLRRRCDPLAGKLPPHVTVVFPFAPDRAPGQLAGLLERQRIFLPIRFALEAPVADSRFLYFPLGPGREAVTALRAAVHAALPGLGPALPYLPHLTFGRLDAGVDPGAALRAGRRLLPAAGVLRRLVLERIGDDESSITEWELRL